MKSYAIAINNFTGDESTISAFDAFLLREENNSEYKKLTLYYEVIDDEYKVFPRFNKSTQRAHFVFYTKNDNSIQSDSEGESLTHYVAKTALANLSTLHLVNKKNNIYYISHKTVKNLSIVPNYILTSLLSDIDGIEDI